MPNYKVRMAGPKSAEILLYDEIGPGGFFSSGISAKQFAEDLKELGKIETLNVRVNSPGGDVFDGLAIYNTLKRHPANVIIDIDGMALSIASVIVMAGDEIRMAENAMMMIHDPWTVSAGTAEDFRAQADLMDTVKGNLVTTYQNRTQLEAEEIGALMSAETWMTANEAKKNRFIDSVTDELQMAARFDLSRFRNTPKALPKKPQPPAGSDLYRARIAALKQRVAG